MCVCVCVCVHRYYVLCERAVYGTAQKHTLGGLKYNGDAAGMVIRSLADCCMVPPVTVFFSTPCWKCLQHGMTLL